MVTIADSLWRQRFGADPQIVGRAIVLDGTPYTVVGVLPPDFRLPLGAQLTAARRAVSSIVPARIAKRARARYFTRTPLRSTTEERAWVIEIYKDDIRTLERLLQRDLSAWVSPESLMARA